MARHPIPADLKPENIVLIQDTREQLPLDLSPFAVEVGTLDVGDYSVRGIEDHVTVERKSLSDFLGCVGGSRDRFEREIRRMRGYETRAIVVETTEAELSAGNWRSQLTISQVMGAYWGWIARDIPIVLAGDHKGAAEAVKRILFTAARRRWRENRVLLAVLDDPPEIPPGDTFS